MEVMEKQELYKLRAQVFGLYPFITPQRSWVSFNSWLELRSIDSLTNEERYDLCNIADMFLVDHLEAALIEWDGIYKIGFDKACAVIDYLRSIGIALPYLGHSVEELVQLGIVKLKA
jgi:hypothetical protein